MEVSGKITKILDKVTGHKKDASGTWEKQNFVLETDEKYNNIYCFEIFGAEKVFNFNQENAIGSLVTVQFNVKTNEYQGKYYTSLQAWKIGSANAVEQSEDVYENY
tara:strand:- start:8419 stop:8736 length:318 start_codon:yes stop_codon:yes gene_type:complete